MTIPVAVTIAERQGEIALIERSNETYSGKLAVPGGKVETGENAEEAAKRELAEETGLTAHELVFHGVVSEVLHEQEDTKGFALMVFEAASFSGDLESGDEGEASWISPAEDAHRILESDLRILGDVRNSECMYYNSVMSGAELVEFTKI